MGGFRLGIGGGMGIGYQHRLLDLFRFSRMDFGCGRNDWLEKAQEDMQITLFPDRFAKKGREVAVTAEIMADLVANPVQLPLSGTTFRGLPREEKERIKDVGGYVAGQLKDGRRTKEAVISRSFITLDLDEPGPFFLEKAKNIGIQAIWHTTASHTPERPRCRLILPLTKPIGPVDYEQLAHAAASLYGGADPSTCQSNRLMFLPLTFSGGYNYGYGVIDGEPIGWLRDRLYGMALRRFELEGNT